MDNEQDMEFPVGFKRPPRHTQFKPGRSGNPNGRPQKKGATFAESIQRELDSRIDVVEGGKRRKITKRDAIAKQQTNKAVNGDAKAIAIVMSAVESRKHDAADNLPPVVHAMQAIHAKHEAANQNGGPEASASVLSVNATGEKQAYDDQA